MSKKQVKIEQGFRQLEEDAKKAITREQSVEDWFNQFKAAARDVFKDAKDVSVSKYCPHLDRWITLKSNPYICECEQCIIDMEKNETNDSN